MPPSKQFEYDISNYFLAFCLLEEFYILLSGLPYPHNRTFWFLVNIINNNKHNAKFSLHAKISVITLSFIMNKVPSSQP